MFGPLIRAAQFLGAKEVQQAIVTWKADLDTFKTAMTRVEKIRKAYARFEEGWLQVPASFNEQLIALKAINRGTSRPKSDHRCTDILEYGASPAR